MTNPVILLGTQSNGETLPVQVDAFGRLVAEGLPGPEGPAGPPGIGQLPPDPYEGALLGWLNGELAWLTNPVPIPEGVFGPIAAYDNGLVTIQGGIPADVGNGVYLDQVDREGNITWSGINSSKIWSDGIWNTSTNDPDAVTDRKAMFDGDSNTYPNAAGINNPGWIQYTFNPGLTVNELQILGDTGSDTFCTFFIEVLGRNGWEPLSTGLGDGWHDATAQCAGALESIRWGTSGGIDSGRSPSNARGIKVNGEELRDPDEVPQFRVNQVLGDQLIGSASENIPLTVGNYLRIPPQSVAGWLLSEVDPTSLIDHLRSS